MNSTMVKIDLDLPPNCQIKDRGSYKDVYFIAHRKFRPDGWPSSIHLGKIPKSDPKELHAYAWRVYEDYKLVKTGVGSKIPEGSLHDCCNKYEASGYYKDLTRRTQEDYDYYIKEIKAWSKEKNHAHVRHIEPKHCIKWLNKFEDTPVKQRRARTVLGIIMGQAIREGFINVNPVRDIKLRRRKKDEKRKVVIWKDDDIDTFVACTDAAGWPSIGTAVLIAFETGQREGDVLSMQKPRDYENGRFKFFQSKTGQWMDVRATKRLKARLMILPEEQLMLVRHETTGQRWRQDTFIHKFREIADLCGLKSHIFMHLRHSAVLNLEIAGCTPGQIAAITGHSLKTVMTILETYRTRSTEVADTAIMRLESYRKTKLQTKIQTSVQTK